MREREWVNHRVALTSCCGMYELEGVCRYKPSYLIEQLKSAFKSRNFKPLIVFTDNEENNIFNEISSGDKFAEFLVKNKYGTVIETGYAFNPNSGNNVKGYLWMVNKKKFSGRRR